VASIISVTVTGLLLRLKAIGLAGKTVGLISVDGILFAILTGSLTKKSFRIFAISIGSV